MVGRVAKGLRIEGESGHGHRVQDVAGRDAAYLKAEEVLCGGEGKRLGTVNREGSNTRKVERPDLPDDTVRGGARDLQGRGGDTAEGKGPAGRAGGRGLGGP